MFLLLYIASPILGVTFSSMLRIRRSHAPHVTCISIIVSTSICHNFNLHFDFNLKILIVDSLKLQHNNLSTIKYKIYNITIWTALVATFAVFRIRACQYKSINHDPHIHKSVRTSDPCVRIAVQQAASARCTWWGTKSQEAFTPLRSG